ncbi:similar to Saccharomyces cerevisiae YIL023C YKE4 Zinc transporter [Maudiozyma barnettii]|uniref:Similar to Saccharomyces cerevisiae YIL023C YKE4 Zinc transporter n=1 Tax=Maudiozyma barnettii TaxID=61262 RepID=A0A8H2ZJ85_9SACH|nr:Zn(2+) transporter YKE4 [Kazachstania barnettii]CAB4255738.1 similar to Saccharomyces cerevisiae YIL023C YKE4 Zinc transporter [Kazachstania barnettii]CAD1784299.1 similar to Saccharomyces cerevisiae YIL023C YKE4 Zinc transporter [Kazachstania barnettii]
MVLLHNIGNILISVCSTVFAHSSDRTNNDIHHHHGHQDTHDHVHTSTVQLINPAIITSIIQYMEKNIFIWNPLFNSLCAVTFIQLLPFITICLLPVNQLNIHIMVSFALGTLLGEIFLHLIPESNPSTVGMGLFIGVMTFLSIDKLIRILSINDKSDNTHSHSHGHSHSHSHEINEKDEINNKNKNKNKDSSIYLSIITALIHNVTDGITIATSFYKSVPIGTITMIAFLFHELPHQLSDYAILSTSNESKFQFFCKSVIWSLVGSWIGTSLSGIINQGVSNTVTQIDDYLVPFSAGGLIYIAAIHVLPEILNFPEGKTKSQLMILWCQQVAAIIFGFYIMALMAE